MDGHYAPLTYHALMLSDVHRMDAYERAIRQLVRPGDVVLDLGSGTGILALLAARRGARVHAVESMRVAALAEVLVHENGLADRITVHRADARMLEPQEPVDLVVTECLGSFLVDDNMLPAAAAAARWLKPGGRFCPSEVRLLVAPIGDVAMPSVSIWKEPFYGIDLRGAVPFATATCPTANLAPSTLIAQAAIYHRHDLADDAPVFDGTLRFVCERDGELAALAGWFEAELAPDIVLSNAPGIETHWGQLLFPLPKTRVSRGDEIVVRLSLEGEDGWRWSGTIAGVEFDLDEAWYGRRMDGSAPHVSTLAESVARGDAASAAGDFALAAKAYGDAIVSLQPADDALSCDLYEKLGVALWKRDRYGAAARAFLRALDGNPTARKQSLTLLISCFFRTGKTLDGERLLPRYEAAFGDHPEGWKVR